MGDASGWSGRRASASGGSRGAVCIARLESCHLTARVVCEFHSPIRAGQPGDGARCGNGGNRSARRSSAPSGHAEVSLCRLCQAALELLRAHRVRHPHPDPPRRAAGRPTSFWGGELLGFTARPIASPIDHNHLQLVVAVGKEAGHHAAEAVAREAGLLSLLRHPQVLQQAALPPVVGLWDRGRPVRGVRLSRVSR